MSNDKRQEMYNLLSESHDLAGKIIDFVQREIAPDRPGPTEYETKIIKGALAIAYTTICAATETPIHDIIDMVMTIYKNTIVEKDEGESNE